MNGLTLGAPGGLGVTSDAAVAELPGFALDEIFEAPAESEVYAGDHSLTLRIGTVYVVRSRVITDGFGQNCQDFGKMTPVTLDLGNQVTVLEWVGNPYCYDRDLEGEPW